MVTRDDIIGLLSLGEPMTSKEIAEQLGTEHLYSVRSALGNLTRFGTCVRAKGGKYKLHEPVKAEFSTKAFEMKDEILSTEKATARQRKEVRESGHKENVSLQPDWPKPVADGFLVADKPSVTLEDIEAKVDESRDDRIKSAIQRLKDKQAAARVQLLAMDKKAQILSDLEKLDKAVMDELIQDICRK